MSKLIDKLTPEQEAMIPVYRERYLQIGLSTEPCDRPRAEAALRASYKFQKLTATPEIIWADSPFAGAVIAARLANGVEKPTEEMIKAQAEQASYGSIEAYWVSFYAFIAEQLPVEKDELIDIVKEIVMTCGVYWTFEDTIVVTEKPTKVSMVDGKLHDETGFAVAYKDGTGFYAINGQDYENYAEMMLAKLGQNDAEKQA